VVRTVRKRHALPGKDFRSFADNRRILYLRSDLTAQAAAILAAVGEPPAGLPALAASLEGAGNRRSSFGLKIDPSLDLFVRYARRGGLIRLLISDLYFGTSPRMVRELAVAAEARRRGIPVAEPIGAIVMWLAPMLYRGVFLTRALPGMTVWQFVQTDDDPLVRLHVAGQVRQAINLAHQNGLFHADLNLHNIFITNTGERFTVALLDLDKARISNGALSPALRERNFVRLRRSIRKLDPNSRYFNQAMIMTLTGA
jgi:tRNA A-37 threonylcarbamoyl transferase component Bud32